MPAFCFASKNLHSNEAAQSGNWYNWKITKNNCIFPASPVSQCRPRPKSADQSRISLNSSYFHSKLLSHETHQYSQQPQKRLLGYSKRNISGSTAWEAISSKSEIKKCSAFFLDPKFFILSSLYYYLTVLGSNFGYIFPSPLNWCLFKHWIQEYMPD